MRIYLLRILVASCMIPMIWIVIFPLALLLSGFKIAIQDIIYINKCLWNGME